MNTIDRLEGYYLKQSFAFLSKRGGRVVEDSYGDFIVDKTLTIPKLLFPVVLELNDGKTDSPIILVTEKSCYKSIYCLVKGEIKLVMFDSYIPDLTKLETLINTSKVIGNYTTIEDAIFSLEV
jgi:hypothetical protein